MRLSLHRFTKTHVERGKIHSTNFTSLYERGNKLAKPEASKYSRVLPESEEVHTHEASKTRRSVASVYTPQASLTSHCAIGVGNAQDTFCDHGVFASKYRYLSQAGIFTVPVMSYTRYSECTHRTLVNTCAQTCAHTLTHFPLQRLQDAKVTRLLYSIFPPGS